RIELVKAKSVRGYIAVAADPGLRLTPDRTQGLTEVATAFFPRKLAGIQSAFRLTDPTWEATLRLDHLPQTVQVDALHLFSIGEGVAYGSSVLNYTISGAPVSAFQVELSDEYFNVEFTGKDIRNWQKTDGGFLVQLHSPVSGACTLLATYERPFKSKGETLAFTGARPLGTQSDQGYTVIISAYQFQVAPIELSPGLLPLETREVPSEYRLFFDAPVLAAYRYNSRPFALKLSLSPLAQGESLSLVVDRAALKTKISKEGQVLTEARYCLKNRGNPHLRLKLPEGTQLWSSSINGNAVVPVLDKGDNLIPLPQSSDPNAVLTLDLKLASRSSSTKRLRIAAPILGSPVMLADWQLQPDAGQRLEYRSGSLTPASGEADNSGFAQWIRLFHGDNCGQAVFSVLLALVVVAGAAAAWRWGSDKEVARFSARHLGGGVIGIALLIGAVVVFKNIFQLVLDQPSVVAGNLSFLAPVQQAGSALTVEVANLPDGFSLFRVIGYAWPVLLAFVLWVYAWIAQSEGTKRAASLVGWTALAWAALRFPNGAAVFLGVFILFLLWRILVPLLRSLLLVSRRPEAAISTTGQAGGATAVTLLCLGGLLWLMAPARTLAATNSKRDKGASAGPASIDVGSSDSLREGHPTADSVIQDMLVQEKFATVTAHLKWRAQKGQLLPVLFEPAVLTSINFPANSLKLIESTVEGKRSKQLMALA
ncbi:MAG TPA: hypothetical protein VFL42_07335, partial [Terriglobales bacterium]|nr:hypothetical protein [Terriglobales bacterium]